MFAVHMKYTVEETVQKGYETTQIQLNLSIDDIKSRIESIVAPENISSNELSTQLWLKKNKNKRFIEWIILNRQCERFLYDLLNILLDNKTRADEYSKTFRCKLNQIHDIVKFRTSVSITNIFVSTEHSFGFHSNHFPLNSQYDLTNVFPHVSYFHSFFSLFSTSAFLSLALSSSWIATSNLINVPIKTFRGIGFRSGSQNSLRWQSYGNNYSINFTFCQR